MSTTSFGGGPTARAPIGLLLRKLDRLIDERFERTLGARGVSRRQWQLLNTVADGPASADALTASVAPFLSQESGETARQHLEPLARDGFLHEEGGVYALTARGRELFQSLAGEVRATRELLVAGLAEGEYERTIATLQTMARNLEEAA